MDRLRSIKIALALGAGLGIAALGGCSDSDSPSFAPILLSPEGNRLHAYDTEVIGEGQVVIPGHADDPEHGRDINGQVCVLRGTRRFIAGEDTGQPTPPPSFGVFELSGSVVGELSAVQVGRLTPTFQGEPGPEGVPDTADPYGCGFLSDGQAGHDRHRQHGHRSGHRAADRLVPAAGFTDVALLQAGHRHRHRRRHPRRRPGSDLRRDRARRLWNFALHGAVPDLERRRGRLRPARLDRRADGERGAARASSSADGPIPRRTAIVGRRTAASTCRASSTA